MKDRVTLESTRFGLSFLTVTKSKPPSKQKRRSRSSSPSLPNNEGLMRRCATSGSTLSLVAAPTGLIFINGYISTQYDHQSFLSTLCNQKRAHSCDRRQRDAHAA